jgi:filamentous hemagglutinin
VQPGQAAAYGELKAQKKAFGETEALDMDHQPSFAAQVAAEEAARGVKLTAADRAALKASTPAVASPRRIHQTTSPTYGGRNTPDQIAQDAANRAAAQARDRAILDEALKKR